MTEVCESSEDDTVANATRGDLERLNGLLIRALIRKLENDEATATDIGNAVKVVVSNRVQPREPEGPGAYANFFPEDRLDFPVKL